MTVSHADKKQRSNPAARFWPPHSSVLLTVVDSVLQKTEPNERQRESLRHHLVIAEAGQPKAAGGSSFSGEVSLSWGASRVWVRPPTSRRVVFCTQSLLSVNLV